MRKLTTMLLIASMLCSTTTGANNSETVKAAEVTKYEVKTVSVGAIGENKTEVNDEEKDEKKIGSDEVVSEEVKTTVTVASKKIVAKMATKANSIKDFKISKDEEGWKIKSYIGKNSEVVIPSEYKGKKIISIGAHAFDGCKNLKKVEISKNIKEIELQAFYSCDNLQKIKVEKGNEHFSSYDNALYNKEKTELLHCPKAKTSIILPATVEDVNTTELYGAKLSKIQVKAANKTYSSYKGLLYNKEKTELICVPREIKSIVMPKTVTEVTFWGAKNASITVEEGNTSFQAIDDILYNKDCTKVFYCAGNKKSVVLPETVEHIASYAFSRCDALEQITFPANLSDIDFEAFSYCSKLKYIKLPDNDTGIGINAFAFINCPSLEWIYFPKKVYFFEGDASHIYGNCRNLTDVYYAGTETSFWNSWDCETSEAVAEEWDAMEKVETPSITYHYETQENKENSIKNFKISEAEDGESWKIDSYIGKNSEVVIPSEYKGKKIISIGEHAFDGCKNLKKVEISKNIKEIELQAFYSCDNLQKIKVENGNKYFSSYDNALYNKKMTKLLLCPKAKTSIILPATVKDVDISKLYGAKLSKIQVKAANKTYSSYKGILYNKKKTILIFAPTEIKSILLPKTVKDVEALFEWQREQTRKVSSVKVEKGNKSFKVINNILYNKACTKVFYCAGNKKSAVLPKTVSRIGYRAFSDCSKLEYIKLPDKNTRISIDAFAFVNCSSLKWIYFSKNVSFEEEITSFIYGNCRNLTDVYYAGTETSFWNSWDDESVEWVWDEWKGMEEVETPSITYHYETKAPL